MKNILKTSLKLFLICFLTIISGCDKDLYEDQIQNSKSEKITFEQFKRETGLKDFKKSISISTVPANTDLRITQTSFLMSDFDVDLELINKLVILEKTTYTFRIEPKKRDTKNIYNLIVFKNDTDWKMCIMELVSTPDNFEKLKQGLTDKFEGGVRKLYDETVTTYDSIGVRFSVSYHCTKEPGYCNPTCDNCPSCMTIYNFPTFDFTLAPPSTPGDTGGNGLGYTSGGAPMVNISGISFEANLPTLGDYYIFNENSSNFYNSLQAPEQNWADVYNQTYNQNIIQYLIDNQWSQESDQFARELVSIMTVNPSLNLNAEASSKSPANIDRSAIDTSTPAGAKFNLVYEELLKSPEFKNLFVDLFENNDRFNVKFQIGVVPNGANGNTDTNLENPTLNTIKISPQYLLNSNKMEIAKTIIHECIHAFLNVKLCDAGQGMSISNLNNMDFYNVVNQEYNGFTLGQNQHNFIYNYMIPTMVTILSEVKYFLVSAADNAEIQTTVLHPNNPNLNPTTPFNWNDCYYYLSLDGLQNCSFFQNEIGIFNLDGTFNTIIDLIKMNLIKQYKNIRNGNLH